MTGEPCLSLVFLICHGLDLNCPSWGLQIRDQLPVENQTGLRTELLKKAALFSKGYAPMVLTKTCVAVSTLFGGLFGIGLWLSCCSWFPPQLAAVALQVFPDKWPNMLQEVFQGLSQYQTELGIDTRVSLLEFLIVLPEEISTATFITTRKKVINAELATSVATVAPFLNSFLVQTSDPNPAVDVALRVKALRGLKSWISFGIPIE